DQPAVLGECGLEDLAADDLELERARLRAPLLHRLGDRAGELGEHPVGVPALAEPAARPGTRSADLALVGEHRRPLRARDREDDGRDHRRGAALPPLGAVDAAELREAPPRRPVEAQRRAEPPPVHGPPRLAERPRSGKRAQRGGFSVMRPSARSWPSTSSRPRSRTAPPKLRTISTSMRSSSPARTAPSMRKPSTAAR